MNDVRRRVTSDGAIAGVNIVPVIDLCLVLLVILLIISPMLEKAPLEVQLPKARSTEEKQKSISITVSPDGRVALDNALLDPAELPKLMRLRLKQEGNETLVVIRSDENVSYGELTKVLAIVKEAGARNVAIGTQQIKENGNLEQ